MTRHDGDAGDPALDVYWRPGCVFCVRLRLYLAWKGIPVRWHNIWSDRKDAAFVRSVAHGSETVPTVVLDGNAYVNPSPRWLARQLTHRAAA